MRETHDQSGLPTDVTRAAVTVGTFDGVHLGHRDVLHRLATLAKARDMASVLVTFAPHPTEVVRPSAVPMLLTPGMEKFEALATIGIDYCAVLPFTRTLAALTASEFVRDVLRPRFRMEALMIGHDHGFGRDRAGGREQLMALGASDGFHVEQVEPVALSDGTVVSSSAIRTAVADGDLAAARRALGRRYSISGVVQRGDQRGRTIGFPTINLGTPMARKLLPPAGVYAAIAQTPGGAFGAMMNLGSRPTVADSAQTVEAHLLDFSGDLYGASVRLDLVGTLRPIRRFAGLPELMEQLELDRVAARTALTRFG
ncbi:MAG TPA: bifunctional riboflavin kinase/FAD synthetase [Gemmatimonadaceae bacterium]|nr:bifunctional riboflavin kinase/FAD synthetase [Gemmatimonadaceae bacterium]